MALTGQTLRLVLTFLQSLFDEFLQLQSLLVPRLVPQESSDVLQGSLIFLEEEQG